MPVPSAVISVPISALPSIRSKRARSTFRILPFSGRIAWNLRSRPCLAEPPALSPSTMKISDFAGSRSWQSASLPGSVRDVQHALAARQFARLARRLARGGRVHHLLDDAARFLRMRLEPVRDRVGRGRLHHRLHLGADQLVLGLRLRISDPAPSPRAPPSCPRACRRRRAPDCPSCPCPRRISSPRGSAPGGSRRDACRRRAGGCCW